MNNNENRIYKWNELKYLRPLNWIPYKECDLIIGNGASIAINQNFNYKSLYDYCVDEKLLTTNAIQLFNELNTVNFEQVLLACLYAKSVNHSLGKEIDEINDLYKEVRKALIIAIRDIHPLPDQNMYIDFERIWNFASKFRKVFSLNYDLTFYWTVMEYNSKKKFRDGFIYGKFDYSKKPNIFYPHGSLLFTTSTYGDVEKISAQQSHTSNQTPLLDTIFESWNNGRVPLFVSEGTTKQKQNEISRNSYLSTAFRELSKANYGNNIVFIYGFSFSDNDTHILEALKKRDVKQLFISVYTGEDGNSQSFCYDVKSKIKRYLPYAQITFFDALSPGCWNN